MKNVFVLFVGFVCLSVGSKHSTADSIAVLWDQGPNVSAPALIDQGITGEFDFQSTYMVSDVSIGTQVDNVIVTTFFSNSSGEWLSNVENGYLNIFDGDGLTDLDDPTSGGDFGPGFTEVTVTDQGNFLEVSASLQVDLAPGTYWIGLSPITASTVSQEFHLYRQLFR